MLCRDLLFPLPLVYACRRRESLSGPDGQTTPLTKKQSMMKKLFVICAWTLLLGGCESDSGNGRAMYPPPPSIPSPRS